MCSDIRVRYSWVEREVKVKPETHPAMLHVNDVTETIIRREPKNTLVTLRKDGIIYFGIARCNIPLDHMDKKQGKETAQMRVACALGANDIDIPGSWTVDGSLKVHDSGMLGQVSVDEVTKLLQYFDNLDDIMLAGLHSKQA